ncbi:MAG: hypothetical protein ACRD2C_00665 [Acidimicrobiales bacterium]
MARTLASLRRQNRQSDRQSDRDGHGDRCIASGWQLRRGCTDGHGHGICPACTRPVRMHSRRPLGEHAWVVESHRAA